MPGRLDFGVFLWRYAKPLLGKVDFFLLNALLIVGVPFIVATIVDRIDSDNQVKADMLAVAAESAGVEYRCNIYVTIADFYKNAFNEYVDRLHFASTIGSILGKENANLQSVYDVIDILEGNRADTLKETLNFYDDVKHKRRLEESQQRTEQAAR